MVDRRIVEIDIVRGHREDSKTSNRAVFAALMDSKRLIGVRFVHPGAEARMEEEN